LPSNVAVGLLFRTRGETRSKSEMVIKVADKGRTKKIPKLPFEMIRDCRNALSNIGPNIKANIKGAPSYLNFLKRYPTNPKKIMVKTSNRLLLRL